MINIDIPDPTKVFNDQILSILKKYDDRIEVFWGGASSGKSQGVYQKVVMKATRDWTIPRRILILRKVGASIKDSSWQHVKDVLSEFKLLSQCKVNKSDMTITLPNHAIFLFKGLDDPEKIKSIKGVSDIVLEEATEFTLDDYLQLNIRLREPGHPLKQMFLMFNPVSKRNWVHPYFFGDTGYNPACGAVLYWSTYKDNRFLDEVTINELEMLRFRNPAYYKIYALGQFATLDKLIFPIIQKRLIDADEVKDLEMFTGLDFGYVNDPSALVVTRYDEKNKRIFITKEYVEKNLLNNAIAKKIHEMELQKEVIFADSSEPKSIDEIKALNVPRIKPTMKGKDSVITGIQWLLQNEIIINELCFKTIEEFENYTWIKDKKTGEYTNEPVDSYNHTIDALRYALNSKILMKKRPQVVGY